MKREGVPGQAKDQYRDCREPAASAAATAINMRVVPREASKVRNQVAECTVKDRRPM